MALRLSGMVSGMDTEALVSALVSQYSLKKDNLVKAQTKVSWKQEKWKATNKSIYNFYSGKLSSARFSSNYNLKSSAISNSSFAKVTASPDAVNGTQTLKVKKLASAGYLTGGQITSADGSAVKGDSKIADVTGISSGSISINVGGKVTSIDVNDDMTVNKFVAKLKDAGVNANFDAANKRFFISSKTSGKDNDFSITANDASGLESLKKLGLYTVNDTDTAEYNRLAALATDSDAYNAELEKMYKKVTDEGVAKSYANKYNAAAVNLENAKKSDLWQAGDDIDTVTARRDSLKSTFDTKYAAYASTDDEGNVKYDEAKLKEDGKYDDFAKEKSEIAKYDTLIKTYNDNEKIVNDTADYVSLTPNAEGNMRATADPTNANVTKEVTDTNDAAMAKAKAALDAKIDMASKVDGTGVANTAVRIAGQDSEIELNGATFTNNTNNYSINGLTIEAIAETGDTAVSITTTTDVDGIYNKIKDFFKEYNDLIKSMDVAYNATSSKGYEPLTDDEKDSMSDDEVEKWETKIKDSLLRKDSTLGAVMNSMKNDMLSTFKIDGKDYALSSFGIATLGYFSSPENETGVYHINGDADDSHTASNSDKLRAAIANDPDTVVSFFSQLANKVYSNLGNKMASSSTSSAYTVYNDKQMSTQYSEYNSKISTAADAVTKWEDYYFKKFSSMESMLAKLNQQQSSLFGTVK